MNQIVDQLVLVEGERVKYEIACNHVRELNKQEFSSAKLCHPKKPGWFIHTICWLLSYLGRLMLAWGERLQEYSLAAGGHNV